MYDNIFRVYIKRKVWDPHRIRVLVITISRPQNSQTKFQQQSNIFLQFPQCKLLQVSYNPLYQSLFFNKYIYVLLIFKKKFVCIPISLFLKGRERQRYLGPFCEACQWYKFEYILQLVKVPHLLPPPLSLQPGINTIYPKSLKTPLTYFSLQIKLRNKRI